ncbi:MAG: hypothetical protein ACK5MN_02555 [Lachnospiraceae bacterium]
MAVGRADNRAAKSNWKYKKQVFLASFCQAFSFPDKEKKMLKTLVFWALLSPLCTLKT